MKNNGWALLGLALGVGIVVVLLMSKKSIAAPAGYSSIRAISGPKQLNINSQSYENEEIREITYNADGLPTRIVITRHAGVS